MHSSPVAPPRRRVANAAAIPWRGRNFTGAPQPIFRWEAAGAGGNTSRSKGAGRRAGPDAHLTVNARALKDVEEARNP